MDADSRRLNAISNDEQQDFPTYASNNPTGQSKPYRAPDGAVWPRRRNVDLRTSAVEIS